LIDLYYIRTWKTAFHDGYVSLTTTNDRIEADYVLPDRDSDTPNSEYLFSDEYETTGAELHSRDGNWVLHIYYKMKVESVTSEKAIPENGTVLAVDLGVNNLAVTSTGTFWPGDELDYWRHEYENRRGDLQQCGTRWPHEDIQLVGRKGNVGSSCCCIALATNSSLKPVRTGVRSSRSRS
jgi:transposase